MKHYLVVYWNGIKAQNCIVEAPDDYIPYKDRCYYLREQVVKQKHPERMVEEPIIFCGGDTCNGHRAVGSIPPSKLELIAVSNLDS